MNLIRILLVTGMGISISTGSISASDYGMDISKQVPGSANSGTGNTYTSGSQQQTNTPLDELARNDIIIATTGGIALGAVVGALIGGKKGALIGAGSGAVAGLIAGNVAANRRRQFASEQEYLDAEIASAQNAITTKEGQLQQLEINQKQMSREIDELEIRHRQNQNVQKQARNQLEELDNQIQNNKATAVRYQESIAYLDETLKTTKSQASTTREEKENMEGQVAALTGKREELNAQYARLLNVNEQMEDDRMRLAKLTE